MEALVKKLDKRRAKQCKGGSIRPKERVKLVPSVQSPPADAPAWAVLPHYRSATPSEAGTTPVNHSADLSAKRHLQYDKENSDSCTSDSDSDCDVSS